MANAKQTPAEIKALAFLILRNAVDALEVQADPKADLDQLQENFKLFHNLVLTAFADLVDLVGGDADCIPVPEFLADDIDTAFILAKRKEDARATNYSAPYTTMDHRTQGLFR